MLYNLLYPLAEHISAFNVFKYITFRAAYSAVTALLIMLVFGTMSTEMLRRWKLSQRAKGFEPAGHKRKEGTPTMGGIMIVLASSVATIMWSDLNNRYVWITLLVYVGFAAIGFFDDYVKTIKSNPMGIPGRLKFALQSVFALIGVALVVHAGDFNTATSLSVPFFKHVSINLGWFYIVLGWLVVVGSSNAVNLTDGLDGLAIMPSVTSFAAYGVFAYIAGNVIYSDYLTVIYMKGAGELLIFCSAMVGAGLGFLWYNSYPASVFMGDVGSLSIGGALGIVAIIAKQEILLILVGGIFVVETLSVILQVGYFRLTKGKRIFLMAPLHHHFELKGWSEPKIIVRFWIISFLMTIIAISTLKIR